MPRKTPTSSTRTPSPPGFNEAAARCRGKPAAPRHRSRGADFASMRPRPDAAENGGARTRMTALALASMRPRPDAAENGRIPPLPARHRAASMRPRPDAAENAARGARAGGRATGFNEAAARCRGKHAGPGGSALPIPPRFNEAAARCRGKHGGGGGRGGLPCRAASMRPRPDAAENQASVVGLQGRADASMRPRPDAAEN